MGLIKNQEQLNTHEIHKTILDGIVNHHNTKKIADSVGITVTGINYHIRKLFRRFGVTNRRSLFLHIKGLPDLSGKDEVGINVDSIINKSKSVIDHNLEYKLKIALYGLQRIRDKFPRSTSMHKIANIYISKVGMEVIDDMLVDIEVKDVEHITKRATP